MTELSEDAALLADTVLFVRARFIEAADSFAHVQVSGTRPSVASGFWPAMISETVDGDYVSRYRPSPGALSRMEEVMHHWLPDYIGDAEQRVLVLRWSASIAVPKLVGSFRSFCKKTGRNRTTAERRADVAFYSVASSLLKGVKLLREPDWQRVMPMLPEWGSEIGMVAERVTERHNHWRADDARPTDLPESRNFTWADDRNDRRRRGVEMKAG